MSRGHAKTYGNCKRYPIVDLYSYNRTPYRVLFLQQRERLGLSFISAMDTLTIHPVITFLTHSRCKQLHFFRIVCVFVYSRMVLISCGGPRLRFTVFCENSVKQVAGCQLRGDALNLAAADDFLPGRHTLNLSAVDTRCSRLCDLQSVAREHSMTNWALGCSDALVRETITPCPTPLQMGPLAVRMWETDCMMCVCVCVCGDLIPFQHGEICSC